MSAAEHERAMRDGIARTARSVQDRAKTNGVSMTAEQAQARVVRAVNTTHRQQGG